MIFVTVGTELPFNRMVQVVDDWAARSGRTDVFAQIGQTDWTPTAIAYQKFLDPADFAARFAQASVIISHAGMGTILSALHVVKPILVVPRRASLGEHRNEHQLATARRMRELGKIQVAFDEAELLHRLGHINQLQAGQRISPFADPSLTNAIRDFILPERVRA
ncbi:MAG: hypothetical protein QOE70_6113 [Chthoniobacter sp.]|jgi:UDP-N-acetylglucosamine transferase subunit ALG13|nr:hypothetical protein [Chthoniobacter sp.]